MAVVDEKSWLVICTSNDGRVLAPRIGSLVNDVVVEHDPQNWAVPLPMCGVAFCGGRSTRFLVVGGRGNFPSFGCCSRDERLKQNAKLGEVLLLCVRCRSEIALLR